jgi:hypothetical protein
VRFFSASIAMSWKLLLSSEDAVVADTGDGGARRSCT